MAVVNTHRDYADARVQWDRCRDAYSGSDAIKKKATAYLPMLEGHTAIQGPYLTYAMRALFYPAMARTVGGLAGLVFAKPPTVNGLPKAWATQFDDVTQAGVSLKGYALELCVEALITGRVGTLIDMAPESAAVPGYPNRPYWTTYAAENIINWRTERRGGKQQLTLVVLMEAKEVIDLDDIFVPKVITQYRVLRLIDNVYRVTIFTERADKKGEWVESDPYYPQRRGVNLDYIPFTFLGPNGIGPDVDHPPLVDLVDVNLSHYRTSADQEHGAHFTALPTPYITGHQLPPGGSLSIGSGEAWVIPNANARAGMVEFTGAGMKALADLKEEKRLLMITLGAKMLETQKNVQEAAQTVALRHASEHSALSVLADSLGQALTQSVRWHLAWLGVDEKVAADALVTMNPESMDTLTADDMAKLVATWQAGAISKKTVYYNLEYGEWTRPGVDFDQEEQDILDETPEPTLNLPPAIVPAALPPAGAAA